MKPVFLICLLALIAVAVTPLRAGKLVAIVEESDGDTGDAQLFDMLEVGQVITLGSGGRLAAGRAPPRAHVQFPRAIPMPR